MSDYKMIPCAHYDYLELACLRGYQLNIELIDGTQCQGKAITTQTRADKTEWLIIQLQQTKQSLRLDHIAAITPLEPNANLAEYSLRPSNPSKGYNMATMILSVEIGHWIGGHNGQYPHLIEFDMAHLDRPFQVSEGWGHGLGGSAYSLAQFVETPYFLKLKTEAPWAFAIIEQGLAQQDIETIATALSEQYGDHPPLVPAHLMEYLLG